MVDSNSRRLAGRYELRSLIGRGGMAEVRLGYDTRLERIVAVKMLRTDLARDSIFQERFRREAQSAASLNHPAIVAVYDTGEELLATPDGQSVSVPYIVMEYVEGHTVRDLLQNGEPVEIDEAVEIVSGVLSALEYSHHEGLVHRDIKPGNIMLTNSGKVKVMDFGIARALTDSQATMTQTDAVVGTAQYLSPEQAQGQTVDARSDLYSTGCVLFELLTGRPPFKADTAVAVAYQHVSERPPTPSSIASDIPSGLDRVVLRSLAKRPADRYETAEQMRADLQSAVRGGEIAPPPATAFIPQQRLDPTTQTTTLPPLPPTITATASMGPQTGVTPVVDQNQKSSYAWVLWITLAVTAILGLIFGLWMFGSGNSSPATVEPTAEASVTVPDVVGKSQAEARAALRELGLEMRIDSQQVNDDSVPPDSVVSMKPQPGSQVQAKSTVTVVLSKGPKSFALPDVSGKSDLDATRQLTEMGLSVSVKTVDNPQVEKGRVIGSDPEPGTELKSGDSVTLNVASGYLTLPNDLVGKNQQEATKVLQDLGLSVQLAELETDEAEPGTVMRLNPVGSVPIRSEVQLWVAIKPIQEQPVKPQQPASPEAAN